ncbi:MAG: hypothetical protein U9N55_05125 [candidate division Zixibacteria bacterium]|nr:hypothetical protein [candidate division Zixibacteria bacterium]
MSERVKEYRKEREKLNELVLSSDNVNMKRFFALDSAVYRDGALDAKNKGVVWVNGVAGAKASSTLRRHRR